MVVLTILDSDLVDLVVRIFREGRAFYIWGEGDFKRISEIAKLKGVPRPWMIKESDLWGEVTCEKCVAGELSSRLKDAK